MVATPTCLILFFCALSWIETHHSSQFRSVVWTTRDFTNAEIDFCFPPKIGCAAVSLYVMELEVLFSGGDARYAQSIIDQEISTDLVGDGILLLSADIDGFNLPPTNAPGVVLSFNDDNQFPPGRNDQFNIFEFNIDWQSPHPQLTFELIEQKPVPSFNSDIEFVPQPGTDNGIESLSTFLMFRLAYRNFGEYESFVVCHSVVGSSSNVVGKRW